MTLNWLPKPTDFRGELKAALQIRDRAEGLEKLVGLAQQRLGLVDTIQLDRALTAIMSGAKSGFSSLRLAILASSTVDHLSPAIRVGGLRRRLLIDIHTGAYGQYRQDLLDASSDLHQFAPHMVLFSITARDAVASLPVQATSAERDGVVARSVDDLRLLWRKARESLKARVVQQTFLNVAHPIFGNFERLVPGAPSQLAARLNDRISEAAAEDGVLLLDVASVSERDGIDAWFDIARWLQAKMEIAPQAAPLYGDLVSRIAAAERGLSKKCLVLDLDNTLWGGVVGDDGLDGIVLGEGSARGEAHVALQRYAGQLKNRGVILAVCSKNDPAIAEAAFRQHPEMVLRRSDIASFKANWDDKAKNLQTIAKELNVGIDSLVFVDDNPVERARIRQNLPMVAVPELPEDPAHYVRCLADAGYFEAVNFTPEDVQRAALYAANTERDALARSFETMDDFLRGLEMSVAFGPFAAVDLARVTQLINKTNQFNPTTRRCTQEEVGSFAADHENITLQFRLLDKFGDNGLVSAMILRPDPGQPGVLEVDTWVMSCRVFGRQLEFEAMNIAVEQARCRGSKAIRAAYIPTPKNAVISNLYPSLGFSPLSDKSGDNFWILDLAKYVTRSTHIFHLGDAR
jgi:FkbH-like protein